MRRIAFFIFFLCLGIRSPLFPSDLQWTSPTTLSTGSGDAADPQIVIDSSGNVVTVWAQEGAIKAVTKRGVNWSSEAVLASSGGSAPKLGMDRMGNSVAVWLENGVVKSASLPAGGNWSGSSTLSDIGASSPELAVDGDGNAVAIWIRQFVEGSTKLVGNSWSSPELLYPTMFADYLSIAVGANGSVIGVWHQTDTNRIYAIAKTLLGDWGAPIVLSNEGVQTAKTAVAIDPNGNAVALWLRYSGTGNLINNVIPQAAEFTQSLGTWGSPLDLSSEGGFGDPGTLFDRSTVQVAFDSMGNGIALWNIPDQNALLRIQENERIQGVWQGDVLVQIDACSYAADLCVSPSGTAAMGYMATSANNPSVGLVVRATTTDLKSAVNNFWSFPIDLSTNLQSGYPRIAINSTEEQNLYLSCVWIAFNGANKVIQGATGYVQALAPPVNLSLIQSSKDRGLFTEYYNTLSWDPSPDPSVAEYVIYRDGILINRVASSVLQMDDPNRQQNETVTYGVASLDGIKNQSVTATVSSSAGGKKKR